LAKTRKAIISDAKIIHKFINTFARKEIVLPRPLNDIYEHIRDFFIVENNGDIIGACSLHILWEDLAEVRSLVVSEHSQKQGIGKLLVKRCIREARKLGIAKVFALTYTPDFFLKMGFAEIDKTELPQKIWGDCMRCPKFPECDEFAVIKQL
jgi:amino-acid N-acetyltransferase